MYVYNFLLILLSVCVSIHVWTTMATTMAAWLNNCQWPYTCGHNA